MPAKLLSAFCLMLLLAAMSPLVIDFSDSHGMGMGMGRRHHGMGPMMGGGRNLGENPVEPTANSVGNGRALFQTHCVVCHGPQGRGDGAAAAGLNPRPADLVQSARMLSDGVVAGVITDGRGAMPSFKAALTQPQIWDLTNFVKSLQGF